MTIRVLEEPSTQAMPPANAPLDGQLAPVAPARVADPVGESAVPSLDGLLAPVAPARSRRTSATLASVSQSAPSVPSAPVARFAPAVTQIQPGLVLTPVPVPPVPVPPVPLVLGSPSNPAALTIPTPVFLAPMAGVTNGAYRTLCYEQGAGVCVNEMITARGVTIGDAKTVLMMTFMEDEPVKAVQLYGTDPDTLDVAIGIAIEAFGAELIDLNFGCPVPKVTRKGGGGVLPWKLELFRAIVRACVASADRYGVPVTLKCRIGIDDEHTTFRDVGRIAEDAGIAAVCLHARTVAEAYSGRSHWDAITELVGLLTIPVLGNGDIWEGQDAVAMMAETGCAGVEVGRGCLGRPWLFADIRDALAGVGSESVDGSHGSEGPRSSDGSHGSDRADGSQVGHRHTRASNDSHSGHLPSLGEVCALLSRHAELNVALMGEHHGMADMRKHTGWYLRGFPVGSQTRLALSQVTTLVELGSLLSRLDPTAPFPVSELGKPHGRQGSPRGHVIMPYGWLNDRSGIGIHIADEAVAVSGG